MNETHESGDAVYTKFYMELKHKIRAKKKVPVPLLACKGYAVYVLTPY